MALSPCRPSSTVGLGIDMASERIVLFFTVSPIFEGNKADPEFDMSLGEYDAEAQIHAGWLLWRAGKVLGPEVPRVVERYDALGFNLSQFGKGEKLRYKSDGSHEDWSKPTKWQAGKGGSSSSRSGKRKERGGDDRDYRTKVETPKRARGEQPPRERAAANFGRGARGGAARGQSSSPDVKREVERVSRDAKEPKAAPARQPTRVAEAKAVAAKAEAAEAEANLTGAASSGAMSESAPLEACRRASCPSGALTSTRRHSHWARPSVHRHHPCRPRTLRRCTRFSSGRPTTSSCAKARRHCSSSSSSDGSSSSDSLRWSTSSSRPSSSS